MRVRKINITVLKIKFGHSLLDSQSNMVTVKDCIIFVADKRKYTNLFKDTNFS